METSELTELLERDGEIVTERLDHWCATTPDKVFLHYGEDNLTWTYAQFADLTDRVAGNLAAHGVGKGDKVSVLTTNSHLAIISMFAIWKAGAVYSPVNFAFTGRLLAYQLNDTEPTVLITDARLLEAVNQVVDDLHHAPVTVVFTPQPGDHDAVESAVEPHRGLTTVDWSQMVGPADRPAVSVAVHDPANIVYTSGTTGPSKGVVQPYRWMAQYTYTLRLPLTSDDVIYSDLPMYHVGGAIANVARAAWVGCEVAVWDRFSPNDFWDRIASRSATTAILLDVMIPWLMQKDPTEHDRDNTLNKVYLQPLPAHHAEVCQRFGFDFVSAGFGQTESGASVAALIEELPQGEGTPPAYYRGLSHEQIRDKALEAGLRLVRPEDATRKGFMGVPVPFCEVTVRNEFDQECAVGEPGELALRPRLPWLTMLEYLGKPEVTAKAWRNLWLHTGDAAVLGEDGILYFVDRLGDRIRVRGENLSSYQVEDIINQHPQVQFCAAFAIKAADGDEDDIVACVVPVAGADLDAEAVRAYCATTMPKYMRPTIVEVMDDLPRTATNKVEKYKLRQQVLATTGRADG